jgi:hypothetical protein
MGRKPWICRRASARAIAELGATLMQNAGDLWRLTAGDGCLHQPGDPPLPIPHREEKRTDALAFRGGGRALRQGSTAVPEAVLPERNLKLRRPTAAQPIVIIIDAAAASSHDFMAA